MEKTLPRQQTTWSTGEGIGHTISKPVWLAKRRTAVRMISNLAGKGKRVEKETFQRKVNFTG